jgi:hypothetical protein
MKIICHQDVINSVRDSLADNDTDCSIMAYLPAEMPFYRDLKCTLKLTIRSVDTVEVTGSIPVSPTSKKAAPDLLKRRIRGGSHFGFGDVRGIWIGPV